eukprot:507690-Alexandrium_andersonii.AAC.1
MAPPVRPRPTPAAAPARVLSGKPSRTCLVSSCIVFLRGIRLMFHVRGARRASAPSARGARARFARRGAWATAAAAAPDG